MFLLKLKRLKRVCRVSSTNQRKNRLTPLPPPPPPAPWPPPPAVSCFPLPTVSLEVIRKIVIFTPNLHTSLTVSTKRCCHWIHSYYQKKHAGRIQVKNFRSHLSDGLTRPHRRLPGRMSAHPATADTRDASLRHGTVALPVTSQHHAAKLTGRKTSQQQLEISQLRLDLH